MHGTIAGHGSSDHNGRSDKSDKGYMNKATYEGHPYNSRRLFQKGSIEGQSPTDRFNEPADHITQIHKRDHSKKLKQSRIQ